jgi:hypothetical protein
VAHLAEACQGQEQACPAASFDLQVATGLWGDVLPGVLNAIDIAAVVDKTKDIQSAIIKPSGLLQPNEPNPQGAFGAQNIAAVVDAVKGLPYNSGWTPQSCP